MTTNQQAVTHDQQAITTVGPTVRCVWYDVTELADPYLWDQGMAALPWLERRDQIWRFRFDKDRRLCLGAGLIAADMLRQAGATDLRLAYGAHGKPYLESHPNIHFNLSHSGTLAVCAVSDMPVGVDVEEVCDHGRAVAKRCFVPDELAWLGAQDDTARAFARLWTRKESYMKLVGCGISRDPLSFCTLGDDESCKGMSFEEFQLPGYALCVCVEGAHEVVLSNWSPSSLHRC